MSFEKYQLTGDEPIYVSQEGNSWRITNMGNEEIWVSYEQGVPGNNSNKLSSGQTAHFTQAIYIKNSDAATGTNWVAVEFLA